MSKRPRPPYSQLTPAQRGALTRRARAEGKDPKRVHAAYKAAESRLRNRRLEASRHGQQARTRTEQRLSREQRRDRQRDAERLRRATRRDRGVIDRQAPARRLTLRDLGRIRDDDYEIEIEGHQDSYTGEWT